MTEDTAEYKVPAADLVEQNMDMEPGAITIRPEGQPESPMAMMLQAKAAGFQMAEIKEMMDLQDRNDRRTAKQAFDAAMADFKRNPPKVIKDMENKQYDSQYASIGNVVNTVNEAMGPFGLNARWEFPTPDGQMLFCTCVLAHALGHEERVTLDAPIDESGKKNALQQRRSTRTYLRLETFEAVTGIASQYNVDDDGNAGKGAPAPVEYITDDQALQLDALVTDNELDEELILRWLANSGAKAATYADVPAAYFDIVKSKINAAIQHKQAQA